jgi:hypothetical protein
MHWHVALGHTCHLHFKRELLPAFLTRIYGGPGGTVYISCLVAEAIYWHERWNYFMLVELADKVMLHLHECSRDQPENIKWVHIWPRFSSSYPSTKHARFSLVNGSRSMHIAVPVGHTLRLYDDPCMPPWATSMRLSVTHFRVDAAREVSEWHFSEYCGGSKDGSIFLYVLDRQFCGRRCRLRSG